MSWSVVTSGKAVEVRTAIKAQFDLQTPCNIEAEEKIRQAVMLVLDIALEGQEPDQLVNVQASGHASYQDWNTKSGLSNTLTITVSPTS